MQSTNQEGESPVRPTFDRRPYKDKLRPKLRISLGFVVECMLREFKRKKQGRLRRWPLFYEDDTVR
ncbi:UNVERIFIED_CONTAM: hypothetical protein FKN15_003412 [Acipenser sinensis]